MYKWARMASAPAPAAVRDAAVRCIRNVASKGEREREYTLKKTARRGVCRSGASNSFTFFSMFFPSFFFRCSDVINEGGPTV